MNNRNNSIENNSIEKKLPFQELGNKKEVGFIKT